MLPKTSLTEVERLEVLSKLAESEDGSKFLKWLCHDVCAYGETSVSYENGALSPMTTLYNEARKDIWRCIRPYIHHALLPQIETIDVYIDQQALKQKLLEMQELEQTEQEEN